MPRPNFDVLGTVFFNDRAYHLRYSMYLLLLSSTLTSHDPCIASYSWQITNDFAFQASPISNPINLEDKDYNEMNFPL